jgi:hypothetical protein
LNRPGRKVKSRKIAKRPFMGAKLGSKRRVRRQVGIWQPGPGLRPTGFDEAIESKGRDFKLKYPDRASLIDEVVAKFKERYEAGLIHDWNDTMQEFIDAVKVPGLRRYKSGKGGGYKRI